VVLEERSSFSVKEVYSTLARIEDEDRELTDIIL
jgi:hypothetical protein